MSRRDEVAMALRAMITGGRLSPGDLLPTRAELQAQFAAGPMTIHHAITTLADEGFVITQQGARTRVADILPHQSRYGLVLARTHASISGRRNRFQLALQLAADEFNRKGNQQRIQVYADVEPHAGCEVFRQLLDDVQHVRLAGVIFVFKPDEVSGFKALDQSKVPLVSAGHTGVHDALDTTRSARLMAESLRDIGRNAAAYLGHYGNFKHMDEIEQAFADCGVALPQRWRVRCGLAEPEGARDLARLIFGYPPGQRPDALVVADDNLIEQAIAGVVEAGVCVPDDVAIVSHWNFPLPLPDVAAPFHRVGFDAHQILADSIAACDQHDGSPVRTKPRRRSLRAALKYQAMAGV